MYIKYLNVSAAYPEIPEVLSKMGYNLNVKRSCADVSHVYPLQ